MVYSGAQRFWSAVAAATAFVVLALAQVPYEPQAESGSCCYRTPKAGCARRKGAHKGCPYVAIAEAFDLRTKIHTEKEDTVRVPQAMDV
jgi:hypothetical protein